MRVRETVTKTDDGRREASSRSKPSAELEDFAGEIRVLQGPPPRWLVVVPHLAIAWALGYYLYVQATDPVNLVFAAVFVAWSIYTPIAKRRGWFFVPL